MAMTCVPLDKLALTMAETMPNSTYTTLPLLPTDARTDTLRRAFRRAEADLPHNLMAPELIASGGATAPSWGVQTDHLFASDSALAGPGRRHGPRPLGRRRRRNRPCRRRLDPGPPGILDLLTRNRPAAIRDGPVPISRSPATYNRQRAKMPRRTTKVSVRGL